MTYNKQTISVTEGNEFVLVCPVSQRTFENEKPIDTPIDCTALENVRVLLNGKEYADFTQEEDGVYIHFPKTTARGTYNVEILATYNYQAIRAANFEQVQIVEWSYQSDAEQYIAGSPIVAQTAYVIGVLTDAELDALKAELRAKIAEADAAKAEAEQAKAEYDAKAEMLEDVAQESTSQEIKELVLQEGIERANEYAIQINEIIGDWSNE